MLTLDRETKDMVRAIAERLVQGPQQKALSPPRSGATRDDVYNKPIQGPAGSVSPAEVARDIYLRASAKGKPTMGKGGNLKKDEFPDLVTRELRSRTGNPEAAGLARQQMHTRRQTAEAAIDDLAKREGISYQEATQRYYDANPLFAPTGPRKGLRETVPALSIAGALGVGAAASQIPRTPEELAHMLVMREQGY